MNYLGACGGSLIFHGPRLTAKFDRTIASLYGHLEAETDAALCRHMHFPVGWDPVFQDTMTWLDVYRAYAVTRVGHYALSFAR